jgi:glycosyltransferase involved in cell wall biosynthesis
MNLRVLMLGWELPPYNSGGLGEACLGLAKALANKGTKITFVLPQQVDVKADFMDLMFADIEESDMMLLNSYSTYQTWLKNFSRCGATASPFDFVGGALKFSEKIRNIAIKSHADIIHAHDWLTFPAGVAAKEVLHKPLVCHIHSTEFDRTGGHFPNQVVYDIEKMGLENADMVVPVSHFTKNMVMKYYGIPADKIAVVHNGVHSMQRKNLAPALLNLKELDYKIVLFLGRITLMKGPEYFVRAAKRVLEYEPKTIFVVTGSGDMHDYMIAEAGRLGILDKFLFTGFLRGVERDRIFQSADLYVMPSVSEPFGITPLESMANGTPVLISKQSGVSEVVQHALKVDFWDTEEMANKIVAYLRYSALKDDLDLEGNKELKNINWNKAADKCISIYHQLVK